MKLADACQILDSQRIPITASERTSGPYPYYGANGVQDYVNGYLFDDELVLLAEDGGHFGSHDKPIAYRVSGKCWVNNHAHVLKPRDGVDVDFLCYSLMYYDVSKLINGATRQKLTQADMRKMEIPSYSMEHQKTIASTLGCVFAQIDRLNNYNVLLEQLIKSRFVEMFGDPVINSKSWPTAALQKNIELINGRAYKQSELLESGKYRILRVGNFFTNSSWYYSDMELDPDKYCDNGDLLYAWSASFGPRIWDGEKVIYHYHIWKLRFITKAYSKQFLKHLLDYAAPSFIGDAHGIGMIHLTKQGMESTPFIVPPIQLQKEFERFAMQIDKSKAAVQQAIDKLELLKASLMQEYFG